MPRVDALVQSPVRDSFRVRQVAGLFDLPHEEKSILHFHADLPSLDQPWTIGAIVGPSGSGKSVLARQAYAAAGSITQNAIVDSFTWPKDAAVVDAFGDHLTGQAITRMLALVGFSSPPAWLRPWHVLSNGERFRCDLARALLLDQPLVVMDEFTSVIDRQVARFASAAISKAIRQAAVDKKKTHDAQVRCKRFVAVSCHDDILDWLAPDWVHDTATGTTHWGSLQRPPIHITIRRAHQRDWPIFERHHYLSSTLSPAARCYIATWENKPIAFCATMHQHATTPRRRVHRLVVLPDYQGLGIGPAMLNEIARIESQNRTQVSIVTSHPVLVRSLDRSPRWRRARTSKIGQVHSGFLQQLGRAIGSANRSTASFIYHNPTTTKTRNTHPSPNPSPSHALHAGNHPHEKNNPAQDATVNTSPARPAKNARPGNA